MHYAQCVCFCTSKDQKMKNPLTETGIQAGENHYDLDIIIYATGFRVNVYDFITKVLPMKFF